MRRKWNERKNGRRTGTRKEKRSIDGNFDGRNQVPNKYTKMKLIHTGMSLSSESQAKIFRLNLRIVFPFDCDPAINS